MRCLSHLLSIARGSVAGLTYTANGSHQIVCRQRTAPVNPNTTRQGQIRSDFSGAAAAWNALTDAERRDWQLYGQTVVIPNPVTPVRPTGRQIFVGNIGTRDYLTTRGTIFSAYTDVAPSTPGRLVLSNLDIIAGSAGTTGYQVQVTNPNPEAMLFYVYQSPLQNPARNTYHGQFNTESLSTVVIPAAGSGVILFETPSAGDVTFVRVRGISEDGATRTSALHVLRAISVTTI